MKPKSFYQGSVDIPMMHLSPFFNSLTMNVRA
jgi:hypothetical protein